MMKSTNVHVKSTPAVQTARGNPKAQLNVHASGLDRRALLMSTMGLIVSVTTVQPAEAGPIGQAITGYWRSRQQAAIPKLLAPILSSRLALEDARALAAKGKYAEALEAVRNGSLNCYAYAVDDDTSFETKASIAQLNSRIADPCTYRLVSKNVIDILDDADPIKAAGDQVLVDVLALFPALDSALLGAIDGTATAAEVDKAFTELLAANERFEANLKAALGVSA